MYSGIVIYIMSSHHPFLPQPLCAPLKGYNGNHPQKKPLEIKPINTNNPIITVPPQPTSQQQRAHRPATHKTSDPAGPPAAQPSASQPAIPSKLSTRLRARLCRGSGNRKRRHRHRLRVPASAASRGSGAARRSRRPWWRKGGVWERWGCWCRWCWSCGGGGGG